MKQLTGKLRFRNLLIYFLFAVAVMLAFKAVQEINIFFKWIKYFLSIVTPFIFGFGLAYILNIPFSRFRRIFDKSGVRFLKKKQKLLSILLTYLMFFLILIFVIQLAVPALSRSIMTFINDFPVYYSNAKTAVEYINGLNILDFEITMDGMVESVKQYGMDNLSASISASIGALSAVFSAAFTFFLALVSSIYILAEKDKFKVFAKRALLAFSGQQAGGLVLRYLGDLNSYFRQYIFCQTIDGCILGTLATIELFVIGSPYFLVLGVMLGVVNYIPYFGAIIGSLVAIAVVGFTQSLATAVIAAVVLLVTQQIDGNLIQPRLMGSSFSLSPLLIVISITFGGSLGGPLGMICAIPIVAVLKNMLDDFILYCERKRKLADVPE